MGYRWYIILTYKMCLKSTLKHYSFVFVCKRTSLLKLNLADEESYMCPYRICEILRPCYFEWCLPFVQCLQGPRVCQRRYNSRITILPLLFDVLWISIVELVVSSKLVWFVSLKCVCLRFFQPISYAYNFPWAFRKTVIKGFLWYFQLLWLLHSQAKQVKHFFSCMLSFGFTEGI